MSGIDQHEPEHDVTCSAATTPATSEGVFSLIIISSDIRFADLIMI